MSGPTVNSNAGELGSGWRDLVALALSFGILYFFLLGRTPLANPDEARYAEIPREMLAHSDWVTPRLNEVRYFEKPPLVYWTVGLCRQLFGPGEFSMRIAPALFGLAGILATYVAARRLFGRRTALAAAVVLGTSGLYFILSRILLLDMAVSVLMSTTLLCFITAVRTQERSARRRLFYGLYASAALATLAKGLIGFLVPGAVMFFWLLLLNQWHRLRPLYLPSGILLFLAIAAPWHVLAAQRNPEWAQFYFVHEHWERFTTTTHDRAAPFWFFLPVVLLGSFPWFGFLIPAVREAVAGGWARRKEGAEQWFFVVWIGFVFLFFSKSQSKLIPYILPVFPPLAILLAAWFARRSAEAHGRPLRAGLGVFSFFCGLISVGVIAATFKPGIIRDLEQAAALRPFAIALAVTLLIGAVGASWAARVRGVVAGLGTVAATAVGFYVVLLLAAPELQRSGTKELALIARERVRPTDRVFHYWAFFHDFVYYTERPVGLVSYVDELEVQFLGPAERAQRFIDDAELRRVWAGAGRVWLVARKRDQQSAQSIFSDATFHYHLIAETRTHSLLSNQP
jgi:4-amino-4-deoxy-L-arabinose transferase-like glycosyltransferase